MAIVTIEEAQAKLPELIDHLAAGEQLVITRNQKPDCPIACGGIPETAAPPSGERQGQAHHPGR